MQSIAVCAGSFDPVTYGHIDVARRATTLFDQVVLAVGENPLKKRLLDLETRVRLVREATASIERVSVDTFGGLLIDYCRSIGAMAIVRGLRAVTDFEFEFQIGLANMDMAPGIETVFLLTDPRNIFISSSLVEIVERWRRTAGRPRRRGGKPPDARALPDGSRARQGSEHAAHRPRACRRRVGCREAPTRPTHLARSCPPDRPTRSGHPDQVAEPAARHDRRTNQEIVDAVPVEVFRHERGAGGVGVGPDERQVVVVETDVVILFLRRRPLVRPGIQEHADGRIGRADGTRRVRAGREVEVTVEVEVSERERRTEVGGVGEAREREVRCRRVHPR
jgi:pantetheine-phosphate adenylyltransferase